MSVESKLTSDVRWFMQQAGQATPDTPAVPTEDVVRLRVSLIAEEFVELLDALGCDAEETDNIRYHIMDAIEERDETESDFVEIADALADIDYVVRGTAIAFGLPADEIADEVQRSNASKTPFTMAPNGKVKKNESYSKPDIATILRKHGWDGK